MPTVYRMMKEENGLPKIGGRFGELGARPGKDVFPDSDGFILQRKGGISVGPTRKLNIMTKPERRTKGARGNPEFRCWRYGEGPYEEGFFAGGFGTED